MQRLPQTIDMNPDGSFAPAPAGLSWRTRLALTALGVSFVTGVIACAALLVYVTLLLVPVALAAGLIGFLALRFRSGRQPGTGGGRFVLKL